MCSNICTAPGIQNGHNFYPFDRLSVFILAIILSDCQSWKNELNILTDWILNWICFDLKVYSQDHGSLK